MNFKRELTMYKKILVPLDGSGFSECSLEHVKAIASGCRVPEIILLRVVEPLSAEVVSALAMAGDNLLYKAELDSQTEARNYIVKIKNELANNGLGVEAGVVDGRAAEGILDYAKNNKVDLIVMTTHGKTGISRWFFGSVAQKVLQHSPVPILMISPSGCRASI
jgi:nucleotide-binding universal stress UspA family protein